MKLDRTYLAAVALLAFLAILFSLIGTVAPSPELASSQQDASSSQSSSSSVTHFMYLPSFDSGWINITNMCGQYFNITHNLNTADVFVDITGKQTLSDGENERQLGGTDYTLGWRSTVADEGYYGFQFAAPIVKTCDGGYAIAGTCGAIDGSFDFKLIATDSSGRPTFSNTLSNGPLSWDYATSFIQTSDGGYLLAGYTATAMWGERDAWLIKTDWRGQYDYFTDWNETYGWGGVDDYAYSLIQTSDDGAMVAGTTFSSGNGDVWLYRTDGLGTLQWSMQFGGSKDDEGYSLIQTKDAGNAIGYAIAGYTKSYGSGLEDFYLVKTDQFGDYQWSKPYGGTDSDVARALVQTNDGGYAMAGYTNSAGAGGRDFLLVKTDASGVLQWSRTYGTGGDEAADSLVQTADGGYAIAGSDLLVKTDPLGYQQWNKTITDIYGPMTHTADGGYVLAGENSRNQGNRYVVFLLKTDAESGLAWTDSTDNTVTLYRGQTDAYWNFVRVRVWTIEEPTWQYGDINQDGVVDAKDLYILARNYGKTFSLLSLSGIVAISSVQTYKARKKTKASEE